MKRATSASASWRSRLVIYEDAGARWTQFARSAGGTLSTIREYIESLRSVRTVTAANGYIGRDLTSAL